MPKIGQKGDIMENSSKKFIRRFLETSGVKMTAGKEVILNNLPLPSIGDAIASPRSRVNYEGVATPLRSLCDGSDGLLDVLEHTLHYLFK